MKNIYIVMVLIAGVASIAVDQPAQAADSSMGSTVGFQASLTPDIALHSKTTEVRGLSLNVWGQNPQHSFNLGIVNGSTGKSSGLSLAWIYNYSDSYRGVQWAMVNQNKESFVGWQDAWVNYDQGYFKGLESGLVNVAQDAHGLQLGFVNYTQKMNGVQIGLVNVINSNPWFNAAPHKLARGFPFVNWSF